jgi:DNA recombination protein RmuC
MAFLLPLFVCAALIAAAIFFFSNWRKAETRAIEAEKSLAAEQVRGLALKDQLSNMRDSQDAFKEYAKAAAFETGQQLSSKLLEDHQRERQQANKHLEEFTKNATEKLMLEQKELASLMAKMQGQVAGSAQQLQVLVRAMKHPIGAGAEAELTLDNLLTQLGLSRGTDYDLQLHIAGEDGALRPDALIYLPAGQVMVLDSKASQHIYGLFEAEGTPEFAGIFDKLCATMKRHVQSLAGKAYAQAVAKYLKAQNREASRLIQVMYVPNDEVITRLRKRDPELIQQCLQHDIILAGPDTLPALFLYARSMILEARQQQNQQVILQLVEQLMTDMVTALAHVDAVGGSIKASMGHFDKFARSLNRNVLSRMRAIAQHGVRPSKGKEVPTAIATYQIMASDEPALLDAETQPLLELGGQPN